MKSMNDECLNLDILFLGRMVPKEKEQEIAKKTRVGMQDAANCLQWNLIDGFDSNNCGSIRIVSLLPVSSYPKRYADKKIHRFAFNHSKNYQSNDVVVGHSNIAIIKQFVMYHPLKKEIIKWLGDDDGRKKIIVMYTPSLDFLKIARFVKKHYPEIEICDIIADIPEYSAAKQLHGLQNLYNSYLASQCKRLYSFVDKYVLLTEQMADKLCLKSPHIVMEGIAPSEPEINDSPLNVYLNKKYILYTGTLNYEFGIGTLLEAFSLVKEKDIDLLICGCGEAEKAIKESKDKRVVFLGKVDHKQALCLQRHATVLVNPRQNNYEFTKYSFPSKTMEYLASGVPLVMYKLDGVPDEYDSYITYVEGNDPRSLAETLERVCNKPLEERRMIGVKAKKFVLKEKNSTAQTKKILDFLLS